MRRIRTTKSSSIVVWVLPIAVIAAGCGDDRATDGASVDAARDASDAQMWPCQPAPPPLPPPLATAVTVDFETALPLLPANDAGAIDTFFDGTQIIVVTPQQLHFLSPTGDLDRNLLIELPALGDGSAVVRDIAPNGTGFGAVLFTSVDAMYRFCQIDPITGADESRCSVLSSAPQFDGNVVAEGGGYAVYGHVYTAGEYVLTRWRFDATGGLIEQEALWQDSATSRYLLNAAAGAAGSLLVTRSRSNDLYAHRVDPHSVESVGPPTLAYSGSGLVMSRWTGYAGDVIGHATHMRCADQSDEDYSQRMVVVTRYDLEQGTHASTPMSLRFFVNAAVTVDGDDTAFIYRWDFRDVRLSKLDGSGAAVVSEVPIPLTTEESFEVQFVGAGRTLAPGEYVFVYGGTGNGPNRRAVKVSIP